MTGGASRSGAAALLAAALAIAAAAAPPPARAQRGAVREAYRGRFLGRPAPDFVLGDLAGRSVKLSEMRGRVVLLNFWYSNCPPCRKEMPELARLHERYGSKGLVVLGLNLDAIFMPQAGDSELRKFLSAVTIPYPVLLADEAVFEAYGRVPVQPTSFLVDRKGDVVEVFWGAYPGITFENAIRARLDRGAAAQR